MVDLIRSMIVDLSPRVVALFVKRKIRDGQENGYIDF